MLLKKSKLIFNIKNSITMLKNIKPVLAGFICLAAATSCKKDVAENGSLAESAKSEAAVDASSYLPFSNGTSYNYADSTIGGSSAEVKSSITISGDTTIDGKTFSRASTGNASTANYYNSTGGVTTMVNFNGGDKITTTVLKANEPAGTVWKDEFTNAGVPATYEWKIVAKGMNKTVQGVAYSNVIQVHLDGYATVPAKGKVVFANSDYYYAPNVGLIENTSYNPTTGNVEFHRALKKS